MKSAITPKSQFNKRNSQHKIQAAPWRKSSNNQISVNRTVTIESNNNDNLDSEKVSINRYASASNEIQGQNQNGVSFSKFVTIFDQNNSVNSKSNVGSMGSQNQLVVNNIPNANYINDAVSLNRNSRTGTALLSPPTTQPSPHNHKSSEKLKFGLSLNPLNRANNPVAPSCNSLSDVSNQDLSCVRNPIQKAAVVGQERSQTQTPQGLIVRTQNSHQSSHKEIQPSKDTGIQVQGKTVPTIKVDPPINLEFPQGQIIKEIDQILNNEFGTQTNDDPSALKMSPRDQESSNKASSCSSLNLIDKNQIFQKKQIKQPQKRQSLVKELYTLQIPQTLNLKLQKRHQRDLKKQTSSSVTSQPQIYKLTSQSNSNSPINISRKPIYNGSFIICKDKESHKVPAVGQSLNTSQSSIQNNEDLQAPTDSNNVSQNNFQDLVVLPAARKQFEQPKAHFSSETLQDNLLQSSKIQERQETYATIKLKKESQVIDHKALQLVPQNNPPQPAISPKSPCSPQTLKPTSGLTQQQSPSLKLHQTPVQSSSPSKQWNITPIQQFCIRINSKPKHGGKYSSRLIHNMAIKPIAVQEYSPRSLGSKRGSSQTTSKSNLKRKSRKLSHKNSQEIVISEQVSAMEQDVVQTRDNGQNTPQCSSTRKQRILEGSQTARITMTNDLGHVVLKEECDFGNSNNNNNNINHDYGVILSQSDDKNEYSQYPKRLKSRNCKKLLTNSLKYNCSSNTAPKHLSIADLIRQEQNNAQSSYQLCHRENYYLRTTSSPTNYAIMPRSSQVQHRYRPPALFQRPKNNDNSNNDGLPQASITLPQTESNTNLQSPTSTLIPVHPPHMLGIQTSRQKQNDHQTNLAITTHNSLDSNDRNSPLLIKRPNKWLAQPGQQQGYAQLQQQQMQQNQNQNQPNEVSLMQQVSFCQQTSVEKDEGRQKDRLFDKNSDIFYFY